MTGSKVSVTFVCLHGMMEIGIGIIETSKIMHVVIFKITSD